MKLLLSIIFRIIMFIITNLPLISGIILFIYNEQINRCNGHNIVNQSDNDDNNSLYLDIIPIVILVLSSIITLINLIPILSNFFLKIPHVYIIILTFILVIPSAILYWYYLNIVDIEYHSGCIYTYSNLKTYLEIIKWVFTVIAGLNVIIMLFFPKGRYILYSIIKLILTISYIK